MLHVTHLMQRIVGWQKFCLCKRWEKLGEQRTCFSYLDKSPQNSENNLRFHIWYGKQRETKKLSVKGE